MFENRKDLIRPQEVKTDLRLCNKTVYSLVKTPGLGTQVGKRFYFIKKNLIAWLENGGSEKIA